MAENEKILLNLDTLEKPRVIEPYPFAVKGERFELTDPTDADWQDIEACRTFTELSELCMNADDRERFAKYRVPAWKLEILFKDVQRHFHLGEDMKPERT